MNRNGFKESSDVRDRLVRKHEIFTRYFEKRNSRFYNTYDYNVSLPVSDSSLKGKIRVCWWQGVENVPHDCPPMC